MNARLKRHLDGAIRTIWADRNDNGKPRIAVQCEIYNPPSLLRRTVYLFLDDEDVTDLLLELRDAARIARMPADAPAKLRPRKPAASVNVNLDDILGDILGDIR
jgi:hypothetical protein